MKYQLIILFGPPGSGKGTQAKQLESINQYVQLGMSAMLLNYAKHNGHNIAEHARIDRINEQFKSGGLVAFDDVVTIMKEKFKYNLKKGKRMTLDGFPRTENQAIWLSGLLTKEKVKTLFIHFDLKLATALKRIENRYFVPSNKNIYSSYDLALVDCKGDEKPFQRDLDKDMDVVKKRYHEQYAMDKDEIIDGLRNNSFVDMLSVDGNLHIDEITAIIEKALVWMEQ
jgi:adenylate kinase